MNRERFIYTAPEERILSAERLEDYLAKKLPL
jgi:hypothetical protein